MIQADDSKASKANKAIIERARVPVLVGDAASVLAQVWEVLQNPIDGDQLLDQLEALRPAIEAASKANPADGLGVGVPAYQFTDGTLTLYEEVADAIGVYARTKPEDGEDWESWFEAAFELAVARVRAIFAEFEQRQELATSPAPALSGVTDVEIVQCEESHPNNRYLFKFMCSIHGIELGKDKVSDAIKKIGQSRALPGTLPAEPFELAWKGIEAACRKKHSGWDNPQYFGEIAKKLRREDMAREIIAAASQGAAQQADA